MAFTAEEIRNMTITCLTEDDKCLLLNKAIASLSSGDFAQSLRYLQPLASWRSPEPFIFEVRANAYAGLRDWDRAINNIQQVIRLNPDHADGYLCIGIYLTMKLSDARPDRFIDHLALIEEVLVNYSACLERDPSNRTAWLNAAETWLFIRCWDNALSYSAQCQPYIRDTASKLTREWIACLALALAGDPITEDDRQLISDQNIRLPEGAHDTEQVRILLNELQNEDFDSSRLERAWKIQHEFLQHFDNEQVPARA